MKNNLNRSMITLAALALVGMANAANAQDAFISTDTTINYAIPDSAYIGFDETFTTLFSPTVNLVTGGSIGSELIAFNSSIVNINGGSIGLSIKSNDSSVINIRGGSISNRIYGFNTGTLNFFGTGLSTTLIDANHLGYYHLYQLSGLLSDGSDITGKYLYIRNDGSATFNFNPVTAVPEPGSIALLVGMMTVSTGILLRKRRK